MNEKTEKNSSDIVKAVVIVTVAAISATAIVRTFGAKDTVRETKKALKNKMRHIEK